MIKSQRKLGKGHSLVFSINDEICKDISVEGPEANFQKWVENALFVDSAIAGDEAEYDKNNDESRRAWRLFRDAIDATGNLLELYKSNPQIFQKVAKQLSLLPCLLSRHPDAERFNRELFDFSQSGESGIYGKLRNNASHLAKQSWPVRYAYAIITTIDLTLDTYSESLPFWADVFGYGGGLLYDPVEIEKALAKMNCSNEKKSELRREYQNAYRFLPKWTEGLLNIQQPIKKSNVLDYWRKGKQILNEEIPDFHLRPEWQNYHRRVHKAGAKKGVIQHAIFKDILTALNTIASANTRKK